MVKRGRSKEDKENQAKDRALDRIDSLLPDVYNKDINAAALAFYEIIHEFFGDYCTLKYKFTYPELLRDISSKKLFDEFTKKKVVSFISRLQEKEFSGTVLSKEELSDLLREFRLIVKTSSLADRQAPKLRFRWLKFLNWLKMALLTPGKRFAKDDVGRIIFLASYAQNSLRENNIERSQKTYSEIERMYSKLSVEERKTVYKDMKSLYENIQNSYANDLLAKLEQTEALVYKYLESGSVGLAERNYGLLRRLYEQLPEKNRKRISAEMKATFNKIHSEIINSRLTDMKRFLTKVEQNIKDEKLPIAREEYKRANELYDALPTEIRKKAYERLCQVYQKLA